jgi:hypothetical protein
VVARCDLDPTGVVSIGLYPCRIGPRGEVEPLRCDDPDHSAALEYLRECQARVPGAGELSPGTDDGLAYWRLEPA